MRTLYIADDEKAIRDGIKLIVDWNALGYEICGEAGNGSDAVSDIARMKPDLVLMDIRMPGLSGIDAIKKLTEEGFEGHFIILSGYSDFKYAQAAMKYNVRHYLTKPIDEDELIPAVREINEMLDNEESAMSRDLFLRSKSKKEIIQDIISHNIDFKLLNAADLGLFADKYQIIAYENFNMSDSELPYRFSELFNAAGSRSSASIHLEYRGHDILLLLGDSGIDRFRRFLDHYESVPEANSPLDHIFVAYGCVVGTLPEISESFAQAEELLSRRFFCVQGQHVLGYDDLPSVQNNLENLESSRIDGYTARFTDYL
nr:response regulator [Lachnospiraceae bacterium]